MENFQTGHQDLYRIIAENTIDTIVVVDNRGVVLYVSPSLYDLIGYHPSEYSGGDAFRVIHPEDRAYTQAMHRLALETRQAVDLEYRAVNAQGQVVHVEARVKPVLDRNGEVQYVVVAARDVSERKQAEEFLEKILDNVRAAVFSVDKDFTRYHYLSKNVEKITGVPRETAFHHPIRMHDHIHPDDHQMMMGEMKELLDQGVKLEREIRNIRNAEDPVYIKLMMHPYRSPSGEIERFDGLMMDITEKKRSELALEESEQRYKSLFEHNLDGVFSIELDHYYFVNANPAFERIAGVELKTLTDRCLLGMICEDDHMAVYEALHEVRRSGKPIDLECRLNPSSRGEIIVSITFVPIFLSGRLNGIHGIVKDITKRKQEERNLINSEKRYKELQQSINRFANDLANVMKVSELERRLLDEVTAVLPVAGATITEMPRGQEPPRAGGREMWIRIGEKQHPVYLRLEWEHPLTGMEKEWLETAVHYVTILYDNLHRIEDLMTRLEELVSANETPKWMLRLLFKLSEKERATLSSDLHDTVLQDLINWYRKLESLRSTRDFERETRQALMQVEEGLLDAIHQIRITCNELRPPFLLKMGLVESLRSLFEYTRMFANYEIAFSADDFRAQLNEEQTLGLYRIVQELLNNASKHARADQVTMTLADTPDGIAFTYSDNGVGMDMSAFSGTFQNMGLAGMEKRVLSLEGTIDIHSAPGQGFHVHIRFPHDDSGGKQQWKSC
jgi:PAS domain S-box-containing protein